MIRDSGSILFIFTFIVLFQSQALGQADSTPQSTQPIHYYNSFLSGGLIGEQAKHASLSFTMLHGVRIKRMALGVGIGHDRYTQWRAYTLFGGAAVDVLNNGKRAFFLQGNAGYAKMKFRASAEHNPTFDSDGGLMIQSMAGYRITSDKISFYITAGYKWQHHDYLYDTYYSIWSYPGPEISVREKMERVVVQIGFGFR